MTTPNEARAEVAKALHDALVASDGLADGEFIADWVVVIHMSSVNQPNLSGYYLMTPRAEGAPSHVIKGLLTEGLDSPYLDCYTDEGDL